MRSRIILSIFGMISLVSCKPSSMDGPSAGDQKDKGSDLFAQSHVVMVIDDGIDVDQPVLKDKIVATYTIDCGDSSGSYRESAGSTAKDIAMALTTPDNYCVLRESLAIKKSPSFKDISRYRDKWNESILSKKAVDNFDKDARDKILNILAGEDGKYTYHGTETAGLIAFQNPGIKLVLVQYGVTSANLAKSAGQGTTVATAAAPSAPTQPCPTQADLDKRAKTLTDPLVTQSYAKAVPPSFERIITELVKKHKVSLISYSIAKMARSAVEAAVKARPECKPLDYRAYFKARGAFDAAQTEAAWRERDKTGEEPLLIRAAGNDGYTIDSLEDDLDCWEHRDTTLMVGSFDVNGRVSEFSNRGKCVDSYILGNKVVVALPDAFMAVDSGTSFSTPLLTRFIMRQYPASTPRAQVVADIKSKLNAEKMLSLKVLPEELAYQSNNVIEHYAMFGSGAGAPTGLFELPQRHFYDSRDISLPTLK